MASGVNAIGPTVSIVWRFDQRCRDLSERTDDDLWSATGVLIMRVPEDV